MKKIKNMVKKGGVADIVTLMVIVGLVIALIIAVVLPMIQSASRTGGDNSERITDTKKFTDTLASGKVGNQLSTVLKSAQTTTAH